MDYNKQLESLLGIGLDDYPSSDYSPIEEFIPVYSRHPNFISKKQLATPICELFDRVEVITYPNLYNRTMTLVGDDFELSQIIALEKLINGLVAIYGGDKRGMLWLLEEEIEEIETGKWKGRDWDFPKYDEIHDILLWISEERGILLIIKEKGALLDF